MKKLVMKIALPGAILAFAMALFGVSAYAEETFRQWKQDTTGVQHRREIEQNVGVLASRINNLKGQKNKLEGALKELLQTSDVSNEQQVKQKIQEVKRNILEKDGTIQRLTAELNSKQNMIDISKARNDHNAEITAAEAEMRELKDHVQSVVDSNTEY